MNTKKGKVYKSSEIDLLIKRVKSKGRVGAWITKCKEGRYAVIIRTLEQNNSIAELHEKSDDVYYVIEGEGKIILNGTLHNPKIKAPGELIAEDIDNGDVFEIRKRDIVEIPRMTPHKVIADGMLQYLAIKIYSGQPYVPPFVTESDESNNITKRPQGW